MEPRLDCASHLLEAGRERAARIHQSVAHGQDLVAPLDDRRAHLINLIARGGDASHRRLDCVLSPGDLGRRLPDHRDRFEPLERRVKPGELAVELLIPRPQALRHLAEFDLKPLQGADVGSSGERLTGLGQGRLDLSEYAIQLGDDALERLAGSLAREERIELGARVLRAIRHFL